MSRLRSVLPNYHPPQYLGCWKKSLTYHYIHCFHFSMKSIPFRPIPSTTPHPHFHFPQYFSSRFLASVALRPRLLLLFLLHELSVFIVTLHRNVLFMFYVLYNTVLLLSYSVLRPPSWNKCLLSHFHSHYDRQFSHFIVSAVKMCKQCLQTASVSGELRRARELSTGASVMSARAPQCQKLKIAR